MLALLAYARVSLAHLCCKMNSNRLKMLGPVNLLARDLISNFNIRDLGERASLSRI